MAQVRSVLIIHDIMFNSYCLLCLTSVHTRNERFFYFTLNTLTKLFTWSLDNFIYLGQKKQHFLHIFKVKEKNPLMRASTIFT